LSGITERFFKVRSLYGSDVSFQLLETMYGTREEGIRNFERHVQRLKSSAQHFNFIFDEVVFRQSLERQCTEMLHDTPYRVRATLHASGQIDSKETPMPPLPENTVSLLLAPDYGFAAQSSGNELLIHKTTHRDEYNRAWQTAEALGVFDVLFFNERNELTEGSRSNVFVQLNGQWWTPPVSSGLLPGIMRALILEDDQWNARERIITLADIEGVEGIMVCNALRGPMPAKLMRK
jgi:para-aminobenzoate synthetase / 4-amino-4-deoxychorismate lyase